MIKSLFKGYIKKLLLEILKEEDKIDKDLIEQLERNYKQFSKTDSFWVLLKYNSPVRLKMSLEDSEGFNYDIEIPYNSFKESLMDFISEEFITKISSKVAGKNIRNPLIKTLKIKASIQKEKVKGYFHYNILPTFSTARVQDIPLLQDKVRKLINKVQKEEPELLF